MSDALLVDCPKCAAQTLKKKLSAPAFHLKGSGWYQTDFKDGAKKPAADSDTKEAVAGTEPKDNKEAIKGTETAKEPVTKSTEPVATESKTVTPNAA